jgi:hypothetical protein
MSKQTNTTMLLQSQPINSKPSCKDSSQHIKKAAICMLLVIAVSTAAFAQTDMPVTTAPKTIYPKSVGYFSFILPVVTINQSQTTNDFSNFNNGFAIGFPVGINVLYSDKFGFSYEFTPTIKSTNGETKTSNLLFDPGPMFRFKHGVTLITRLAFETSGRYGFTPVLNKVIMRSKFCNLFAAVSMPVRFGATELPTIGGNFQFGITLN